MCHCFSLVIVVAGDLCEACVSCCLCLFFFSLSQSLASVFIFFVLLSSVQFLASF